MSPFKRRRFWQVFGRPFTASIALGAVLVSAVLIANITVTYRDTRQLERDTHWVTHTFQVIGGLERVLSVMKDAETGQRGYVITQDPSYLEPYHSAVGAIDGTVKDVEQLCADNTAQAAKFPKMRQIIKARLGTLEEALNQMEREGVEGTRQVILSGRGKRQMDELRTLVGQMIGAERELLAQREVTSEGAYRQAVQAGAITGSAALAAIVALFTICVAAIFRRVRQEDERRRQMADIAHAARLTTVGQMMSELSHELNQPLGAAANYARACARLARSSPPDLVQVAEMNEKAAEQSSRALEIVRRVSAFAKKAPTQVTRENLNKLIENVVALTIPSIASRGGIFTTVDLSDNVPEVLVDRVQIEQVLVNLIRNATEAMQSPECHDRSLVVATRRQNDMVEVSVQDHGPGISPETMKKLFSPYFTTKSNGMGLGLSISQSIVEQHHGKIFAESDSRGTKFCFTLPIAA